MGSNVHPMSDFHFAFRLTAIFVGAIVISLVTLYFTDHDHRGDCVGCCE